MTSCLKLDGGIVAEMAEERPDLSSFNSAFGVLPGNGVVPGDGVVPGNGHQRVQLLVHRALILAQRVQLFFNRRQSGLAGLGDLLRHQPRKTGYIGEGE